MKSAKIIWTTVATTCATVVLYVLYHWTMGLFADTPYQLWPFAAFAAVFNVLIASYIVVGTVFFIWEMWRCTIK